MRMLQAWMRGWAVFSVLALWVAAANGQPDYGIDFVTIGHVGNRGTLPSENPLTPEISSGAVNYEYRIARGVLSETEYLEFAQAYSPYVTTLSEAADLAGAWLGATQRPNGQYDFFITTGHENVAAGLSWEMAARYCNWLCNNKATNREAFENGAYDTSTFDRSNSSRYQLQHNPGARFWIPSFDELVKAVYYDPNRYGPGQEGYWQQPNGSDNELIQGRPGTGGETIGGIHVGPNLFIGEGPLGQYPDTHSPLGLIDVSGTLPQYSSSLIGGAPVRVVGSASGSPSYRYSDRIDSSITAGLAFDPLNTLRIASAVVPAPTWVALGSCFVSIALKRRHRQC